MHFQFFNRKSDFEMKFVILVLSLHGVLSMNTAWWKHATIYEIFIWSFKDSNGDGIGDLNGLKMKLDHFVDLGIEIIYLTPFFKSPMQDSGYDVSDYIGIDPRLGTMADFDELMKEMKKRGLKLMIDLVINHSSDQHEWFQKSVKGISPYKDYYVWKNAKYFDENGNPVPPNNWISSFGGNTWEWNHERKQFYLHHFSKYQPDLNLTSNALKEELYQTIEFWFDKGVAGLRLDATLFFIEDKLFRDDPLKPGIEVPTDNYFDYDHIYSVNQWETYEFLHDLRNYVDTYSKKKGDYERIIATEAYTTTNFTMLYYGEKDYPIAHFPFNFDLITYLKKFENAFVFDAVIRKWLASMPKGAVANWNVENHDNVRAGTRLNVEYSDILLITAMMAPGVAYVYYGQEIGMTNHRVRPDQRRDENNDASPNADSRDGQRVPMQWDDSINGGFTGKQVSWLPVNTNYWQVNVKIQRKQPNSKYQLFKTLSALRKTKTLKHGAFESYVLSTWVFAFTRTLSRHETFITVHNLGTETEIVDLHLNIRNLSPILEVVTSSLNSGYEKRKKIQSGPEFPETFVMRPLSSIVLKTVSK